MLAPQDSSSMGSPRLFLYRMVRAARLDGHIFTSLKDDGSATGQSLLVLALAGLSFGFGFRSLGRRRSDRSSCWQRSWYGSRGSCRICLAIPYVSGCNQILQGHVELLGPGPTSLLRNFPRPHLSTHVDSGVAYPWSCAVTGSCVDGR